MGGGRLIRNVELARDYGLSMFCIGKRAGPTSYASPRRLTLKGLLRSCGVIPPRIHVCDLLVEEREKLPEDLWEHLEELTRISRKLRRDRELAFYGAEDLTPSSFYSKADATSARNDARHTEKLVKPHVLTG